MPLVNFRQIQDRFTHIDANFVSCALHLPEDKCRLTVSFYPWWEHPAFVQARERNETWGFTNASEKGVRDVIVYPRGLQDWRFSPGGEVTDWRFTETHPLLWNNVWNSTIDCNSAMTTEQILRLVDLVRGETGRWRDPFEFLNVPNFETLLTWGQRGSFQLGRFPQPLWDKVTQFLTDNHVKFFAPHQPAPENSGVALILDGDNYILAGNFDLDVPEFEHRPEWFDGTVI